MDEVAWGINGEVGESLKAKQVGEIFNLKSEEKKVEKLFWNTHKII